MLCACLYSTPKSWDRSVGGLVEIWKGILLLPLIEYSGVDTKSFLIHKDWNRIRNHISFPRPRHQFKFWICKPHFAKPFLLVSSTPVIPLVPWGSSSFRKHRCCRVSRSTWVHGIPALLKSGTRLMKNLGEEASGYVYLNGAWMTEIRAWWGRGLWDRVGSMSTAFS